MARTKRKTSRKPSSRKARPQGSMWLWYLAAIAVIGSVIAYDNRHSIAGIPSAAHLEALVYKTTAPVFTGSVEKGPDLPRKTPKPGDRPATQVARAQTDLPPSTISGRFFYCTDQKTDCVVDGDTFWYRGERIELAGIDVPETKQAKCDRERNQGSLAKGRLLQLLNEGAFTLTAAPNGDGDAANSRLVMRGRLSLGDQMISEGLARKSNGRKQTWC